MAISFIFKNFGYNVLILKMTIFFSGKLEKGKNWQKMKAYLVLKLQIFILNKVHYVCNYWLFIIHEIFENQGK